MEKQDIISRIKKGLIVSCQAEPERGSRLYEPRDIARMAQEALDFGACAVRVCGCENIAETRRLNPDAIIFGITKSIYDNGEVLITSDMGSIDGIISAGAGVVAMDMTKRQRPGSFSSLQLYHEARKRYPDKVFMADCSDFDECSLAIGQGVDLVGTTLSGYTDYTKDHLKKHKWYEYEPDFDLLGKLTNDFKDKPIIAEGRYRDPEQCCRAIDLGAWAVCIGSQATRIREIVRWHAKAVREKGFT